MIAFQRNGPRHMRKKTEVIKLERVWEKMYILKGHRRFYSCKVSKVDAVRKRRSGANGQEQTSLTLVKLKGRLRKVWGFIKQELIEGECRWVFNNGDLSQNI